MKRVFAVAVLLFSLHTVARASVVYSTLNPDGSYNPCCGIGAVSPTEIAYSFTVQSDVYFTGALLALSEGIGSDNSVTVELVSDADNQPGNILESFTLVNELPPAGTEGGVTVSSLLDPYLAANTQYWMIVFANDAGNGVNWLTGSVVNPGTEGATSNSDGSWSVGQTFQFNNGGFSVFGQAEQTPEPGTLALSLLSWIPLAFFIRRKSIVSRPGRR